MNLTPELIRQALIDNAEAYHQDRGLRGDFGAIKMLLQDDFMDDFGHMADIGDYSDLIDQLSARPYSLNEKRKLITISRKNLQKVIREALSSGLR